MAHCPDVGPGSAQINKLPAARGRNAGELCCEEFACKQYTLTPYFEEADRVAVRRLGDSTRLRSLITGKFLFPILFGSPSISMQTAWLAARKRRKEPPNHLPISIPVLRHLVTRYQSLWLAMRQWTKTGSRRTFEVLKNSLQNTM